MEKFNVPIDLKNFITKFTGRFVLSSHISPDGDNIGSLVGTYWLLKYLGKDVSLLLLDKTPDKYEFLLEDVSIIDMETISSEDVWIILDSSDEKRLGDGQTLLKKCKHTVNIDHHRSNTLYGDYNWVEVDAAATGELVFCLAKGLGIPLDTKISNAIYVAISTDTGSFRYPNTTNITMHIISELHDVGISHQQIIQDVYQNRPLLFLELLSKLIQNLEIHEGIIAYSVLTKKELDDLDARGEDTDGLVEELRDIAGIEISCFLKEVEVGIFKGSLRSKGTYDVIGVAESFGGGGHKKAAGFTIQGTIEEVRCSIFRVFKRELAI